MAEEEEEGKRSTGTVKWFSAQRGFGFIAPDDGSEDLFVHQTSIRSDGFRTLAEGQSVEFVVDVGEDGRAKGIEVAALSRSRRGGRGGGGRFRGSYFGRGRGGGRGGYGGRSGRGGGMCYSCGRTGHFARDCYRGNIASGGGDGSGRKRDGRGGGGGRACFKCGKEGHFARDCLNTDHEK